MTERKTEKKKKKFKIKTFQVPFSIDEIKESISIVNHYDKEKIINRALKLHLQGNILEALKYYEYCINRNYNDYKLFTNYGAILKDLGKLKEAEVITRKAIQIRPDYANSYLNLGDILKDLGNLKEAEIVTLKAIELKPNFAKAYLNLGTILKEMDRFKEAEISTREAIKIKPNYPKAYNNLGLILKDIGKLKEAEMSTRKCIEIKSNFFEAHINLGEILFDLGKIEEANKSEWNAIQIEPLFSSLNSYRDNAKILDKTAFMVHSLLIYNHYKPIIDINPNSFEILVPDSINNETLLKIKNDLKNKNIKIRYFNEIIKNKLLYKTLVSNRADDTCDLITGKSNKKMIKNIPNIKLLGKINLRFMYTAGKDKYTIYSFWNKYYDGILCYGPYHEDKFKIKHKIATSQMGYPRFDKYFSPGFKRDELIKKFNCDPKKKTIVWLPTWTNLSSVEKYIEAISSLKSNNNIIVRPHPSIKNIDPENFKKLFTVDFNYVDDKDDDNVQLFALADLMLFDYGGSMFGGLYLNKNLAFLDMELESKNNNYLGNFSSEDYLKSLFPERIAKLENLNLICNYCLNNPPSDTLMRSAREQFFNTNYQGNSAKRAYELLTSTHWLNN